MGLGMDLYGNLFGCAALAAFWCLIFGAFASPDALPQVRKQPVHLKADVRT